jgi:hypothetical protein
MAATRCSSSEEEVRMSTSVAGRSFLIWPSTLMPSLAGQEQIQQHDRRFEGAYRQDRAGPVGARAHHLDALLLLEHEAEARADYLVVVHDQDPDHRGARRQQDPHTGALAVVTREVVNAADGWPAPKGGVGSVMVVPMYPGLQGTIAGSVGAVQPPIGPLLQQGPVEPLRLPIRLGPIRSSALVAHAGVEQRRPEQPTAVADPVVS